MELQKKKEKKILDKPTQVITKTPNQTERSSWKRISKKKKKKWDIHFQREDLDFFGV